MPEMHQLSPLPRQGGVGTMQKLMPPGCCQSPRTRRCCLVSAGLGSVFLLTGLVVLVAGPGMLEKKILQTMALAPGSDRLQSWLVPPVQAHLTGYAFHVTNPEAVQRGEKPVLEEVGPFVYKEGASGVQSGWRDLDIQTKKILLSGPRAKFW